MGNQKENLSKRFDGDGCVSGWCGEIGRAEAMMNLIMSCGMCLCVSCVVRSAMKERERNKLKNHIFDFLLALYFLSSSCCYFYVRILSLEAKYISVSFFHSIEVIFLMAGLCSMVMKSSADR